MLVTKNITPTSVDEVVRVSSKFQIPPFGCKAIHGRTGLLLMGYKLNMMTHRWRKSLLNSLWESKFLAPMLPSLWEAIESLSC